MPAGTSITTMMMTRITITMVDTALLKLLTWLSPAFPTGGFAYSHGLEWAVETGDIKDRAGLHVWLKDILHHGAGWTDTILLRHAQRAAHDREAIAKLVVLSTATASGKERQAESLGQGNAFAAAARPWCADLLEGETRMPYAVAVGVLTGRSGITEDDAALAFLHGFITNLISAAVRLVPLGQSDGLAVLAALEPDLLSVMAETREATLGDLGSACFRSDIAAMRHETQYTRLFRS
jgi:urease accessory protein